MLDVAFCVAVEVVGREVVTVSVQGAVERALTGGLIEFVFTHFPCFKLSSRGS